MAKSESEIEKRVCKYAASKGCYVRKFSSPAHRGVPDRLFITPDGVVFFIEFKREGEEPTALQHRELDLISAHMGRAFWTDSIDGGRDVIDCQLKLGAHYVKRDENNS